MQHQRVLARRRRAIGDADGAAAARREADTAAGEPIGVAGLDRECNVIAGEQCRRHLFRALGIGDAPPRRRFVERKIEAQIAGGGDRRRAAGRLRDRDRDGVGAAMAAEQRHRDRAVFGHGDDRRLLAFVAQERRQRADEDTAGAQPDDRCACREQLAQMRRRAREVDVAVERACIGRMNLRAGQQRFEPARQRQGRRTEDDNRDASRQSACAGGGHRHASPRRCKRIIEK